jgi:hypothetical protein
VRAPSLPTDPQSHREGQQGAGQSTLRLSDLQRGVRVKGQLGFSYFDGNSTVNHNDLEHIATNSNESIHFYACFGGICFARRPAYSVPLHGLACCRFAGEDMGCPHCNIALNHLPRQSHYESGHALRATLKLQLLLRCGTTPTSRSGSPHLQEVLSHLPLQLRRQVALLCVHVSVVVVCVRVVWVEEGR